MKWAIFALLAIIAVAISPWAIGMAYLQSSFTVSFSGFSPKLHTCAAIGQRITPMAGAREVEAES
jgi:hypothetical protein